LSGGDNYGHLFKWKTKSSNKFESYMFLTSNSVVNQSINHGILLYHEEEVELKQSEYEIARKCLQDAVARDNMLVNVIKDFPLLEKVHVKDSSKRRTNPVSGRELTKMKNLLHLGSPLESDNYYVSAKFYACKLELPVSGYVMKDVTLFVFDRCLGPAKSHSFLSFDIEGVEFDDEVESAYIKEAVMKFFDFLSSF
ncbi:uncharacterized protein LOC143614680, partial [Bidens hawaiensis]|uniref:uncharacterized protein LOC143614680 n=1 Tax=Bidens hawaiensis TaxID=980011 RepID=UPI00404B1D74